MNPLDLNALDLLVISALVIVWAASFIACWKWSSKGGAK